MERMMIKRCCWLKDAIIEFGLKVFDSIVLLCPSQMVAPLMLVDDGEDAFLFLRGDEVLEVLQAFDLADLPENHQQYQKSNQNWLQFIWVQWLKELKFIMRSTQIPVEYVAPPREEETYSDIIRRMEDELALNCFICSHTFNTTTRAPTIVCRRQHTYCAECIPLIQRARPNRCPECRFKIYEENIFINRPLFAILHFFPQLKAGVDSIVKQNQRLTDEINRLGRDLEEMKRNYERQLEQTRIAARLDGVYLQQREERLYTIAKQKIKEKMTPEIRHEETAPPKTNKLITMINPEQSGKKRINNLKMKTRYTKPSATTSKRKADSSLDMFNLRIHSYHAQT